MPLEDWVSLAAFVAACFVAASTGGIFKPGAWYKRLDKPGWTPPDVVFPIVWAVLYVGIAYSGWLIWREAGMTGAAIQLAVYTAQLFFNAFWSFLFFGFRRIDFALIDVVFLWLFVALTIALFAPISTTASLLLAPYLLWVTIAGVLNYQIWRRNPARGVAPASA